MAGQCQWVNKLDTVLSHATMSCFIVSKHMDHGSDDHDSDAAGVRWSSYSENPHLQHFFKVLSLSADRDQRIYISTIEAHKVKFCPCSSMSMLVLLACLP